MSAETKSSIDETSTKLSNPQSESVAGQKSLPTEQPVMESSRLKKILNQEKQSEIDRRRQEEEAKEKLRRFD